MFAEYDEGEIGALDTEEIEGDVDESILDKFISDLDVINTKVSYLFNELIWYRRYQRNVFQKHPNFSRHRNPFFVSRHVSETSKQLKLFITLSYS